MNSVPLLRTAAFLLAAILMFSLRATRGDDASKAPAATPTVAATTASAELGEATDYKLTAGDILSIAVVGERDLQQDCRVSSSGTITFAWLKKVEVAGKTPLEIEELLGTLLDKDYLVDPTVLVAVKEYRTREVTVNGQVNRPGAVPIPAEQPMTIIEAIGRAGGIMRGGDKSKIFFIRRGMKKPERYSWDELNKETDPHKIIYVQPGDVIEIPEKIL